MGEEKKEHNEEPKPKNTGETKLLLLIAIAVLGRILMEPFPSVEPIIPIAVYAGLVYGADAGILVGLFSYPISNFFMLGGPFGWWTILQAAGGAISGGLAGNAKEVNTGALVTYSVIGTIIFELLLNFGDRTLLVWPFSVTHIVTNILFALLIGTSLKEK